LPDGVAQAVFRIVQETLTNVVKHAAATRCRIEIKVGPDEVRIEAVDDGSPRETRPTAPSDSPRKPAEPVPTPLPASRSSPGAAVSDVSPSGGASSPGGAGFDALPSGASLPGGAGFDALPSGASSFGASRSGQGLIGMRERVALFGGQFAAGPAHPHGWRVSATLRYER
jgi:hypothetical protein